MRHVKMDEHIKQAVHAEVSRVGRSQALLDEAMPAIPGRSTRPSRPSRVEEECGGQASGQGARQVLYVLLPEMPGGGLRGPAAESAAAETARRGAKGLGEPGRIQGPRGCGQGPGGAKHALGAPDQRTPATAERDIPRRPRCRAVEIGARRGPNGAPEVGGHHPNGRRARGSRAPDVGGRARRLAAECPSPTRRACRRTRSGMSDMETRILDATRQNEIADTQRRCRSHAPRPMPSALPTTCGTRGTTAPEPGSSLADYDAGGRARTPPGR